MCKLKVLRNWVGAIPTGGWQPTSRPTSWIDQLNWPATGAVLAAQKRAKQVQPGDYEVYSLGQTSFTVLQFFSQSLDFVKKFAVTLMGLFNLPLVGKQFCFLVTIVPPIAKRKYKKYKGRWSYQSWRGIELRNMDRKWARYHVRLTLYFCLLYSYTNIAKASSNSLTCLNLLYTFLT